MCPLCKSSLAQRESLLRYGVRSGPWGGVPLGRVSGNSHHWDVDQVIAAEEHCWGVNQVGLGPGREGGPQGDCGLRPLEVIAVDRLLLG